MAVWHQSDTCASQCACLCMIMLGSLEQNPHSFSNTKNETAGHHLCFLSLLSVFGKKNDTMLSTEGVKHMSFMDHRNYRRSWRTRFLNCVALGGLGPLASFSRSSGLVGILDDCIASPHLHATAQRKKHAFGGSFQKPCHLFRCSWQLYLRGGSVPPDL